MVKLKKLSDLCSFISVAILVLAGSTSAFAAPGLAITSPNPLPTGTVSRAYSTQLAASGGSTPYTWSITKCSGACNTGLGFNSTGVLSGTPQNAGTSTFTFSVKDATGNTASAVLGITIGSSSGTTATPSALAVTSPSTLPNGTVSTPYSAQLAASGGTSPYSWSITSCAGACNTGLGFNASGLLAGTPQNAGTSTFGFKVTDSVGNTASAALNITIGSAPSSAPAPSPSALTITSPTAMPNGTVSTPYSATLTASGGTSPYTWTVASCSGACNSGLSLSPSGVFSGTPSAAGTSSYMVEVTDSANATTTAAQNVTIASPVSTSGHTYYVSPGGSDSNPCSQANPCATPDRAFGLTSPGDTVLVGAGTYNYGSSAAQFLNSGSQANYITVACATRGACKIQNSLSGNSAVVVLAGSYITFDGFEVTNTSSAGNNLGIYVESSYVNITHNTIHHIETDCGSMGGGGIQVAGSGSSNSGLHDITIDGNLIYDISYTNGAAKCSSSTVQTDGILVESAGSANRVVNNVVYHTSGGWGILVGNSNNTAATVNSVISNNTVFSSTGGIIIMSGNGTTISNNIIAYTGQQAGRCGISTPQGVSVTYANNDLWSNAGGSYCLEWGTSNQSVHSGDISVDPALGTTFVNWQADGSGDYHLKPGSPTIDAGASAGAPPTSDFDGNPRPHGAGYDIGAYELQQ